jgi:hypothetical protein
MENGLTILEYSGLIGYLGGLVGCIFVLGFLFWSAEHTKDIQTKEEERVGKYLLPVFAGLLLLSSAAILIWSRGSITELGRELVILPLMMFAFFPVIQIFQSRALHRSQISDRERRIALRYLWGSTIPFMACITFFLYNVWTGIRDSSSTSMLLMPIIILLCAVPEFSRLHRASVRKKETSNHSLILGESGS